MNVVISGGGVAAIESVLALSDLAADRVRITLVTPQTEYVYAPQSVGTAFGFGNPARIRLDELAAEFDVELVVDSLAAVQPRQHLAQLESGAALEYDKLVVAHGAPRMPVYEHAITFAGPHDIGVLSTLVEDIDGGPVESVAFVVPPGVAWSLPAYELALLAAKRAPVEVTVITPEDRPLAVFGGAASDDVERLLGDAGIEVVTRASAEVRGPKVVLCHPGHRVVHADRIVALPVSVGSPPAGLPGDAGGFLPTDSFARVAGVADVYAAGDGTNFPLKQGGIACQQADVAAAHIAHEAGAGIEPLPFRPVLRGRLMTGGRSRYMRRDLSGRAGDREESSERVLWWPGTKVAGRYLAAYLSRDGSDGGGSLVAPGVRRRAFVLPEVEHELGLYGYEFARWPRTA